MVLFLKKSAYIITMQDKIDTFKKTKGEIIFHEENLVINRCTCF